MKRTLMLIVVALAGCHSMEAWRPADGRRVTPAEHEWMVIYCRREAQQGGAPYTAGTARGRYAECMRARGWSEGEPDFLPPAPEGPPGDAASVCAARIQQGKERGLGEAELERVLDGCMAEHGR